MKNFKNILIAFFLSEFGRAIYFVSITWILYQITNDPLYTGLLVGLGFLPGLILNLVFGVIVDRKDRRLLSILATLISTSTMAILLILLIIDVVEPWIIIAVHMILQVAGSLFRPAIQAYIAELFEKEQLPNIFSKSSSLAIMGGLFGAASGGIIIGIVGVVGSMLIVTLSFLVALISLVTIKKISSSNSERDLSPLKTSVFSDLKEGFIYLNKNKFLLGLFVIMFNGQLVFHTSLGFLSVYTIEYLQRSVITYGFLDATLSIGGVIAGLLGTWWWKKTNNKIAIYSLIIIIIGLGLMSLSNELSFVFIGLLFIGLGSTWIRTLLQAVQQIATDANYHGRMASFRMICNQGSVVISGPILGWIGAVYGSNFIYLALMIPISICLIYALFQSKSQRFIEITNKKN